MPLAIGTSALGYVAKSVVSERMSHQLLMLLRVVVPLVMQRSSPAQYRMGV